MQPSLPQPIPLWQLIAALFLTVVYVQKVVIVLDSSISVLTHFLSEVYHADSTFNIFPESDHLSSLQSHHPGTSH